MVAAYSRLLILLNVVDADILGIYFVSQNMEAKGHVEKGEIPV